MTKTCAVEGCDKKHKGRGYCVSHLAQVKRNGHVNNGPLRVMTPRGSLTCKSEGCKKPVLAKGYCEGHYARSRKRGTDDSHKPLYAYVKRTTLVCVVDGCAIAPFQMDMCQAHYTRFRRHGSPILGGTSKRAGQELAVKQKHGYVHLSPNHPKRGKCKSGLEHRAVMETIIGRPLRSEETVHHRNGVRDDNRPTNLELWAKRHPAGSRATDLVIFAREIMRDYANDNQPIAARHLDGCFSNLG